jgi:hypothetical protein
VNVIGLATVDRSAVSVKVMTPVVLLTLNVPNWVAPFVVVSARSVDPFVGRETVTVSPTTRPESRGIVTVVTIAPLPTKLNPSLGRLVVIVTGSVAALADAPNPRDANAISATAPTATTPRPTARPPIHTSGRFLSFMRT